MPEEENASTRPRQPEPAATSVPRSRRAADRADAVARSTRGRSWAPFVILALVLPMGLAQAWFAHAPHAVAYDLDRLDEQLRQVRDDLESTHLACESMRSPQSVAAIAKEMGFERPALPPVVIEVPTDMQGHPSEDRPTARRISLRPIIGRALDRLFPTHDGESPRQLSAAAQGLPR